MNVVTALSSIFAFISFPSMVAGFIYFGRKLEKLDSIEYQIEHCIKPDLKDLGVRMAVVETKVNVLEASVEDIKRVVYRNQGV